MHKILVCDYEKDQGWVFLTDRYGCEKYELMMGIDYLEADPDSGEKIVDLRVSKIRRARDLARKVSAHCETFDDTFDAWEYFYKDN